MFSWGKKLSLSTINLHLYIFHMHGCYALNAGIKIIPKSVSYWSLWNLISIYICLHVLTYSHIYTYIYIKYCWKLKTSM